MEDETELRNETDRLVGALRQHGSATGKVRAMLWGALNTDEALRAGLHACTDAFVGVTARLLYASGLTCEQAQERIRAAWRGILEESRHG